MDKTYNHLLVIILEIGDDEDSVYHYENCTKQSAIDQATEEVSTYYESEVIVKAVYMSATPILSIY